MMAHHRKIIYLAGFLFSLPVALMSYINSSFISSFIGESWMGLLYATASAGSILGILIAPHVLKKIGSYKFLILLIGLNSLSILSFALLQNRFIIVLAFIFGLAFNTMIIFTLDELLKIFSKNSDMGGIRGTYLAIGSSAWVLSQILLFFGGSLPLQMIYLIAFLIMVTFFLLSFFALKKIPDPKYDRIQSFKYIRLFFKNKNLSRSYKINLLLQMFFSIMVIYTPIYLSAYLGMSWSDIGAIFAIMLLPFVILPFHVGRYTDKIGERKMLMIGFFIASLATLSIFFINGVEIWVWATALFFTRVGASTVEVSSDTYFFKHIRPESEEWVGVYRSAPGVGYILGPLAALVVLSFIPTFKFIFPLLGALMLYGVYLASTIRKGDI